MTMQTFRVEVPEGDLADLRERLARTGWAPPSPAPDWVQGTPVEYLRELVDYWAGPYDWRSAEARLNSYQQYFTEVEGQQVHFLHVPSPHPGALPLVLSHGWPGSVVEFLDAIAPLVDPPVPADAFDLVIPSLPGYGFWVPHRSSAGTLAALRQPWVRS